MSDCWTWLLMPLLRYLPTLKNLNAPVLPLVIYLWKVSVVHQFSKSIALVPFERKVLIFVLLVDLTGRIEARTRWVVEGANHGLFPVETVCRQQNRWSLWWVVIRTRGRKLPSMTAMSSLQCKEALWTYANSISFHLLRGWVLSSLYMCSRDVQFRMSPVESIQTIWCNFANYQLQLLRNDNRALGTSWSVQTGA